MNSKHIRASDIKPGDRLKRQGFFHPVLRVQSRIYRHPVKTMKVVEVTHDRGTLCYLPHVMVEVER